jgi:translation initiation factor IF-3
LIAKELRTNDEIMAREVRLIREDEQLGITPIEDAQRMADEADLDLVEIAPNADPPVAKIMDYGKYKYEQAKREREARKSSKQTHLREMRLKVKTGKHDMETKARVVRKLLEDGDKVKVSVFFRAREITHPEVARELLDRFYGEVNDISSIERPARIEGRFMSMTLEPGVKRERRPEPRPETEQEPEPQPVAEG